MQNYPLNIPIHYDTSSNGDQLAVYVSIDCGATFPYKIWEASEDGSGSLSTSNSVSSSFSPSTTEDWCLSGNFGLQCQTLSLLQFEGFYGVVIKFEARSGEGSNLYLDNINISGDGQSQFPVGIETAQELFDLELYPNPTRDRLVRCC